MGGWEWLKIRLFVLGIAIPIVGLFILSVAFARLSRPAFTQGGELLLRYSLPLRLFGVFAGVVVPLAICVLLVVFVPRDWDEAYAAGGSLLFFLLLGGWLLLETQLVRVTVSGEGIAYHSPWRRHRAYSWEEIREVSTFSYMYPFVFRGADGRKFTVSAVLTGVPELVELFRTHLDPSVYEKARRGIAWTCGRERAGGQ